MCLLYFVWDPVHSSTAFNPTIPSPGGAPADGFYGTALSRVECAAVEKVKAVFLNEGIVGSLVVLSDSA